MDDFAARFDGVGRLVGQAGLERLRRARVCVTGIGGVGSWAVEALARSGIGALTLVDLDEVCISNVNRQLPALDSNIGRAKARLMADRIGQINPACRVCARVEFFTASTAGEILAEGFDCLVDAIDDVPNKCRLLADCVASGTPVVSCGGAGGRCDPTSVRTADLAQTSHDPLLAEVRRRLRREHGFPGAESPMGIPCVYSTEPQRFPQPDGTVCECRAPGQSGAELRLNCDSGFGTAAFVTGAFGFAAASLVVRRIVAAGATR